MNLKAGMSIAAAGLASLALTATAAAVPVDRTKTLSSAESTFTWDGAATTAFTGRFWWIGEPEGDCGTFFGPGAVHGVVDKCDVTELNLAEPGTLQADLPEAGDGITNDWDLYVFAGDAATEMLGSSENTGEAESVTVDDLEAGDYYVIAVPYMAVQGGYSGSVSLTPAT